METVPLKGDSAGEKTKAPELLKGRHCEATAGGVVGATKTCCHHDVHYRGGTQLHYLVLVCEQRTQKQEGVGILYACECHSCQHSSTTTGKLKL